MSPCRGLYCVAGHFSKCTLSSAFNDCLVFFNWHLAITAGRRFVAAITQLYSCFRPLSPRHQRSIHPPLSFVGCIALAAKNQYALGWRWPRESLSLYSTMQLWCLIVRAMSFGAIGPIPIGTHSSRRRWSSLVVRKSATSSRNSPTKQFYYYWLHFCTRASPTTTTVTAQSASIQVSVGINISV